MINTYESKALPNVIYCDFKYLIKNAPESLKISSTLCKFFKKCVVLSVIYIYLNLIVFGNYIIVIEYCIFHF